VYGWGLHSGGARLTWLTPEGWRHRSGWRTVTAVNADFDGMGYLFTAELDWPASGYWRARYPGRADFFQSAVSERMFVG
jgi:hypothetical protein